MVLLGLKKIPTITAFHKITSSFQMAFIQYYLKSQTRDAVEPLTPFDNFINL